MAQLTTRPDKFAAEVNAKLPGAHRLITVDDVRDMTSCGLIGRYGYFINLDLETVRAVLQYEQLRQNRQNRDAISDDDGVIHCRGCGAVLDDRPKAKQGRPNEYCDKCQPFRGRERYRKWQEKGQLTNASTKLT